MSYELRGTEDLTQEEKGALLLRMIGEVASSEDYPLSKLANASAFIMALTEDLNWAGFYLLKEDTLYLGPFQGLPACTAISVGQGVCGTAFARGESLLVPETEKFPGHIPCDSASRSELVVPLGAYGVLDLDSPKPFRFTEEDRRRMEEVAKALLPVLEEGALL